MYPPSPLSCAVYFPPGSTFVLTRGSEWALVKALQIKSLPLSYRPSLNARLFSSLPSISRRLTAVEVSPMSTSPHNNSNPCSMLYNHVILAVSVNFHRSTFRSAPRVSVQVQDRRNKPQASALQLPRPVNVPLNSTFVHPNCKRPAQFNLSPNAWAPLLSYNR